MAVTVINGRQVSKTVDGIREDHVRRYKFAANLLKGKTVIDAASGVGYGSSILSDAGCVVHSYEVDEYSMLLHRRHYGRSTTVYHHANLNFVEFIKADAAVSFETIEHLCDPKIFLSKLSKSCSILIGSVPNQDVIPFNPVRHKYHFKHYTIEEITNLLKQSGWTIYEMLYQHGKYGTESKLDNNRNGGSTIVFRARS